MKNTFPAYIGLKRDFQSFATLRDDNIILKDGWRIGKNECSHMGMRFMTEDTQIQEPCVIRCPYHGRGLSSFKLTECGEGLFDPMAFHKSFHGLISVLSDLGEEYQTLHSEVACPWYVWLQNTMDPFHVPHVHKDGFEKVFKSLDTKNTWVSEHWRGDSYYEIPVDETLVDKLFRHSSPQHQLFCHWAFAPSLSVTSFCGVLHSVEEITAMPDNTCRVKTRYFASVKGKPSWAIIKSAKQNNKKIIDEDVNICERLAPTFKRPRSYVPGEERIKALHEWLTQNEILL